MAGGTLYTDADRPYNAGSKSSGLIGRLNMYKNFWLPMKGKIFAALRIPAKLANVVGTQLGGTSSTPYSINQGSETLVKIREADFHATLDSRNLRWDEDNKNELFKPKNLWRNLLLACAPWKVRWTCTFLIRMVLKLIMHIEGATGESRTFDILLFFTI